MRLHLGLIFAFCKFIVGFSRNHAPFGKKRNFALDFNDPKFKDQWYIHNTGQTGGPRGIDINVLPVWKMGITGKGVVVSIIDDGVDYTHRDLIKNYDEKASFDFNKNIPDSMPNSKEWSDAHGTRCAGEIAAEANNGVCGVGVAFNCRVGGIKLLSGIMNDSFESRALSYENNYIDIYSNSWGPKDDGKSYGKPGALSEAALRNGVIKGRNGKGCIYVWATGNGGLMDDDCNCDGYVNSIYTISIGSISDHGLSVYYKESCPSTLAVTFNGGSHREKEENKIITTDLNGKCTDHFRGTSSAAPIASAIFALVLEANPYVTWRDLQHLVVHSSTITSPLDVGWKKNAAGFFFNHKFGFGKLDAFNIVKLAKSWQNVGMQKRCIASNYSSKIEVETSSSVIINFPTDACSHDENNINKLEHVILRVSYVAPIRGFVSIELISAAGTRSLMLSKRKRDIEDTEIEDWDFMTVFNWGESPVGTWKVNITDHTPLTYDASKKHHRDNIIDDEDFTRIVAVPFKDNGRFQKFREIAEPQKILHSLPQTSQEEPGILE